MPQEESTAGIIVVSHDSLCARYFGFSTLCNIVVAVLHNCGGCDNAHSQVRSGSGCGGGGGTVDVRWWLLR